MTGMRDAAVGGVVNRRWVYDGVEAAAAMSGGQIAERFIRAGNSDALVIMVTGLR